MNDLAIINNYIFALKISSSVSSQNTTATDIPHYGVFLEALYQNHEWLSNENLKEVISRLCVIKPENSAECLKIIAIFKKLQYRIPFLEEKNEFQELLMEIKNNSITILSEGVIEVGIHHDDYFQDKQWDCLKRFKRFVPITHISFAYPSYRNGSNIDRLINFFEENPDIISLTLFESLQIDDLELEKISKNLPNIQMFTICSRKITVIPKAICNQITMLDCSHCEALTTIDAPKLKDIKISGCTSLTSLNIPNATKLVCNNCSALTTIEHSNLTELNCNSCINLKNINVPNVLNLVCNNCKILTTVLAPNAVMIDCSVCPFLTIVDISEVVEFYCTKMSLAIINAPKAQKICCSESTKLIKITAPNATFINCKGCTSLEIIIAPTLKQLNCENCLVLKTIDFFNIEALECSCCSALEKINTPNATHINSNNCTILTTIIAPLATSIACNYCPSLTTIQASNAKMLDCKTCLVLETIIAPNLKRLICSQCVSLKTIVVPLVESLRCSGCTVLETITAPLAGFVHCDNCSLLKSITAPLATMLQCANCPILTTIVASNVIRLVLSCKFCPKLTTITAPMLIQLGLYSENCPSLKAETKFNLFKLIFRNILMESSNQYFLLSTLITNSSKMYELQDLKEFPLIEWFIKVYSFVVPAEFNYEDEEGLHKRRVDDCFAELLALISKVDNFKGLELEWFLRLKKFNSPQQEIKRIIWLATIFEFNNEKKNFLNGENAFFTLKVINGLADSFLRKAATSSIFSIYHNEDRYQKWSLINQNNKKSYVTLLSLLFYASELGEKTIQFLMKRLRANHYKNFKELNPILEMIYNLLQSSTLDNREKEKTLKLIFKLKVPKKKREESKLDFNKRKKDYENSKMNQGKWVGACRDLLLFGKALEFKNIDSITKLLMEQERFFREFFGVEEELAGKFTNTFKSERYPNGLFTYAARLQTLPLNERTLSIELLEKFVNACLKKEFPNCRYDLSNNSHLEKIFQNDPILLDKWKEPLKIPLMQVEKSDKHPQVAPHIIIKNLMKAAIENGHLVNDKGTLSKEFTSVLESDNFDAVQSTIQILKSRSNQLQSEKELNIPQIEIDCLSILDPFLSIKQRIHMLSILFEKLPDSMEFKNDIKGMIDTLKSSEIVQTHLIGIESAESWEDFLLMGTEVNNSC